MSWINIKRFSFLIHGTSLSRNEIRKREFEFLFQGYNSVLVFSLLRCLVNFNWERKIEGEFPFLVWDLDSTLPLPLPLGYYVSQANLSILWLY